jgi:flavin-dependent dehydrogenase
MHGVRATGLRRAPDGHVTGITAQVGTRGQAVADAAIVIGADGAGSLVARLVDAANSYRRTEAGAYVYGYFPGLERDLYDWHFGTGVTAGVIPTNDGTANVFVGMPQERFGPVARADGVETLFRAVLREAAPEVAVALRGSAPVGRFHSFPGRPGHLRRAHGPGWALVGDAGYFKDPITAHGITDALRDAELLARSLLTTGGAGAYEAARDLLATPFLDITTAIATHDWDMRELVRLHRELKVATDEEVGALAAFDSIEAAAA